MVRSMRYDEMREHVRQHFADRLQEFWKKTAENGPASGKDLDVLRATQGFAEGDDEVWQSMLADGADGLVRAFCEARSIVPEPEGRERAQMITELRKGHREFLAGAIKHVGEFVVLSLSKQPDAASISSGTEFNASTSAINAMPLEDVAERYMQELEVAQALAAKTAAEKRDALALLTELTGNKPPALMTKSDARSVKDAVMKLPKNRSKNPATRDLPLRETLEFQGVQRISPRTMNVYIGHMQSMFTWAVSNGYANENIFTGMRVKKSKATEETSRTAFSAAQLRLIFAHLTDPNSTLVRKDTRKWPALIGMFTGMRLNEIAQLEISDIEENEGIWCINVTPDGDDNKRLKNSASRRRVPVHDKLAACGFLTFVETQRSQGHSRLFPTLPYSAQNGYGRIAGRWFNERFLPALELGGNGYVFHCLRHSMVTRLAQAAVEDTKLRAIVGHTQSGVTFNTYFKEGFKPAQLHEAISKFDIGMR